MPESVPDAEPVPVEVGDPVAVLERETVVPVAEMVPELELEVLTLPPLVIVNSSDWA